jgi:hypothetical protein
MLRQLKRTFSYPGFIVLFAFGLRMFLLSYEWLELRPVAKANLPYGWELGQVAAAIASGRGFSSPLRYFHTGPTAWFTPIYPYLVAGIFRIWGIFSNESKLIIETLNCAFVSLVIVPIYGIAQKTFGKGTAVGAAWIWVFLPSASFYPIYWIWDTCLAALFLALIFWATLVMPEKKTKLAWAGYGALWITGVMINPSLLSLFPFLAGWALWRTGGDLSRRTRYAAATLLVFFLGLVPWTVRNYRVFGKLIALRSNFGLELWLGNNPGVPDTWAPWLHPNDSLEEAEKYRGMGEIQYMEEKQREAFAFMRTHPSDTLYFMFRRFVANWLVLTDSPADTWSSSPWYLKSFIVMNVLLSLFTLFGALFAHRARPLEAIPYMWVLLVFPVLFYLTHAGPRYRFPMDSIMMILSAYAVAYPVSLWRERSNPKHAAAPAPPIPIA